MARNSRAAISCIIMVVFKLGLNANDMTPPLPDPSSVVVEEPPLWFEPVINSFSITACAGDFYNINTSMSWKNLLIHGLWEKKCEWDTITMAGFSASYRILLRHLWLKPAFDMNQYQRNDELLKISPSLTMSSTLPFAVISGDVAYQQWTIIDSVYYEQHGYVDIIFDRAKYLPHFECSFIRNALRSKARLTAQLHVHSLHMGIGSDLLDGFPSPSLQIKFLTPAVKIENTINSGFLFRTYESYVDIENPTRIYPGLPEESLRVSTNSKIQINTDRCFISISGRYNNWYGRMITNNDYHPTLLSDIEEVNLMLFGKTRIEFANFAIDNALNTRYNWASKRIPFMPVYACTDTIAFSYRLFALFTEFKYLSRRNGIVGSLPPLIVLNPGINLEFRQLRIFFIVFNATDIKQAIYDGYNVFARQYAGGLGATFQF